MCVDVYILVSSFIGVNPLYIVPSKLSEIPNIWVALNI